MSDPVTGQDLKEKLLDAALIHVTFDGWSEASFLAACRDTGIDPAAARLVCPRGAVDLALAYHERGDRIMLDRLAVADIPTMRLRDRLAAAVRFRIEAIDDREAVRRGAALFALPQHAGDGARAIWGTADRIWTALGDRSDDVNWYSKRASLAGLYGATLLYWLGDDSDGHEATWDFLHRRVDNMLGLEKLRAQVTGNPISRLVLAGPNWLAAQIRPPSGSRQGFPGSWHGDDDSGDRPAHGE